GVVFFPWVPKVVDIIGCACLILVSLPLPETFNEPLPDTLHDIEKARFKFKRRYQLGESVSAFAVELRHTAAKCGFGIFLDDALRDQFVAGLRNQAIQATLLKKKKLNFETACDLAKEAELVEKESMGFRPTEENAQIDETIHVVSKKGRLQRMPKSVIEETLKGLE
ncbi:hypothetical protein MTO96_027906, partial [Rhipicephalus appendiculatus]